MVLSSALLLSSLAAAEASMVWPLPQSLEVSGEPFPVSSDFAFELDANTSVILGRAAERYALYIAGNGSVADDALATCRVMPASTSESLLLNTSYAYRLRIGNGSCDITADSIFGATYGMETLFQLTAGGSVPNASIDIVDFPAYQHRGIMLDSGRRFWPVSVVENMLDTMSFNKMNVLHLHASDMCRFAVESLLFPELTANQTELKAGFYSRADIQHLVAYAKDRGIRIVPEFDMPGHAAAFLPLKPRGVKFCNAPPSKKANWCSLNVQNGSAAWTLMPQLAREMADLFGSELYHIGGDEAKCGNLKPFEKRLLGSLQDAHYTTMAWSDVGATTEGTVIHTWKDPNASTHARNGRPAVESSPAHFYLSHLPGDDTVTGKSTELGAWVSLGGEWLPNTSRPLLLGGSVAMWTDPYCQIRDCVFPGKEPREGGPMFDRRHDSEFGQSACSMIWPRGHLAAGSFWRFDGSLSEATLREQVMARHNDLVAARGAVVCPTGCACNITHRCEQPYVPAARLLV